MWELWLYFYNLKKNTVESNRLLVEVSGRHPFSDSMCIGGLFDVEDTEQESGQEKFEDEELQALLDENNA